VFSKSLLSQKSINLIYPLISITDSELARKADIQLMNFRNRSYLEKSQRFRKRINWMYPLIKIIESELACKADIKYNLTLQTVIVQSNACDEPV
jgi:hypothetical protein